MELRQMASAFLFHDHHVLMMRKESSRNFQNEFWMGLGGHVEPAELNDPKQACIREIKEESGITENRIEDLKLRYILFRVKENEIWQQFVYFGKTTDGNIILQKKGSYSGLKRKRYCKSEHLRL
ncbi:NUDIX domain-containing protein [Paenibacillus sp. N1-5-1-14]|uniref:NUDIX domain-containing protein n=1 Tax=Paenibacillus radicibacter TaxID=2972488 RepID=UPI002158F0A6|nr:NUDIX domain-containing protein [Paenibacillus radicibacter]MCR8642007.1 NUDIX domain-containing protein [Paenibacillus radicibacter]